MCIILVIGQWNTTIFNMHNKTDSIVYMLSHMDLWIQVLKRRVNPSVLYMPWVFCFPDLITGLFNQKQDLLWSNSVGIHTCDEQIRLALCPCLLFWINHDEPFHLQDLISNSPYCLPYNSYTAGLESLVFNQLIIP